MGQSPKASNKKTERERDCRESVVAVSQEEKKDKLIDMTHIFG
jgi:hypothetical protein